MKLNHTTVFALVIAVGIVAILVFSQGSPVGPKYLNRFLSNQKPSASEPTGKVDDAVSATGPALVSEESILLPEDQDTQLMSSDSAEINGLGTAYNKNDF